MHAKDAIYLLGGLAVVVFFIARQRRSDRFRERSLVFPIALGIYGIVLLRNTTEHQALTTASAVLLILSAAASTGFGVIRGRTIELFTRGGQLWERASWTTIGVGWGGLLVARVALIGTAAAIGGCGIADLDPAHARGYARGADARGEATRAGFWSAHDAVSESIEAFSSEMTIILG